MKSTKKPYWPDVAQDKKVPKTRLGTRACEESDGASCSSTVGCNPPPDSILDSPPDQGNSDPGPQKKLGGTKRNKRNYKTVTWNREEKKKILYCFTYSRYEKWGRRKNEVFKDMIDRSDLPSEKKEMTTIEKLTSIVSQISVYLTSEEMEKIKTEALIEAERDFNNAEEKDQHAFGKSSWNREERWVLLWAIEYAKEKEVNQFARAKEWQRIFHHHCPSKKDIKRGQLTSQKHNTIRFNHFNEEQMANMQSQVKLMVKNGVCPISQPLEVPSRDVTAQIPRTNPTPPVEESSPGPQVRNAPPEPPDSPPSSSDNESPNSQRDPPQRRMRRGRRSSPPRPPDQAHNILPETNTEQQELEEELANKIEQTKELSLHERPRLIRIKEDRRFKELLKNVNIGLEKITPISSTLTEINNTTYGAAWYIQSKLLPDYNERPTGNRKNNRNKGPIWKRKLQEKIECLRKELSQMTAFTNSNNRPANLLRKINKILRKYNIHENQLRERIAEHQALVKGFAEQIRCKEKKINSKQINKQFNENPRIVYRNMTNKSIEVKTPPSEDEVERFWRPLYEDPKQHHEAEWIQNIEEINREKPHMPLINITIEKLRAKISQYSNFRAPGIDKIPNFWLKKLTSLHPHYAEIFSKIGREEEDMPVWTTTGLTSLLPKTQETDLPNKYRPICCLSTTYKWLTGIYSDELYEHLENNNYLESEQKGCIRNKLGTKDQLLINKTILEDCKRRGKNLSMAWIDYKKAFDSIPHSWILKCLELYNVSEELRSFLRTQMTKWNTTINLSHANGQITIPNVKIQRGIFQGDSLSPLLFCLALDPLSKLLKQHNIGYDLSRGRTKKNNKKINHLLFMDDLKLYADSDEKLHQLIQTVHSFSTDIHMEFGLDKCNKCTIRKGKKVASTNIELDRHNTIEDLDNDSSYKYLGIEENSQIQHKIMREKIHKEYIKRLKKICKSELTSKNKITAVNQLAIPVVTYGIGIVDWPQGELNKLDVKTRKILTLNRVTYRNQCMDRIYLPRREGGLGLTEINQVYRANIISIGQYLMSSRDEYMIYVAQHHRQTLSQQTSIMKLAENFGGEILDPNPNNNHTPATKRARKAREQYSKREEALRKERWREHRRAGKFPEELEKTYIDKEGSLKWLKTGDLPFDGERMIVGAQDQGLLTNGFKKMAGMTQNDKCRFCHTSVESVNHLTSGCQTLLADGHYTNRHNKICKYLHWKACKDLGIEVCSKIWEHEPQPITASRNITIFYDKIIPVGRYIENNAIKPDIVIWNKEKKSAHIIDVAVPNDFGLNRAEREKLTKYEDLKNDLRRTWSLREIDIIPVVVGATGLIKNNLKHYLNSIPGNPSLHEVQLGAIKGTISILKRALGYAAING